MPIKSKMLEKAVTRFMETGAAADLEERMPELRGHRNRLRAEAWREFHSLPLSHQREIMLAANPRAGDPLRTIDARSDGGVLRGFPAGVVVIPESEGSGSSGGSGGPAGDDFKNLVSHGIQQAFLLLQAWYGTVVAIETEWQARRIFNKWAASMEECGGPLPAHVAIAISYGIKMSDSKLDMGTVDRILLGDDDDMIARAEQLHWTLVTNFHLDFDF